VLKAVERNEKVANLNLRIMLEPDPERRKQLQMDLIELHRELGHDEAVRNLERRAETNAVGTHGAAIENSGEINE